jgi:P4 family phage/plasmid primase-like protien
MLPERSTQKALLLLGEGSNGKSTYLAAVEAFVGKTNAAGLSLQKMETDRFAASRLAGKLANICPDLPSVHLTETSMFKALTGGDAVNAEYKYRDSFEFRPFCRLIFSANHVPRSHDASHAFFRRWLVVPFDRTINKSEQVPRGELDAKLQAPEELSGVLNKALDALPGLRHNGFTESKSMREAWEEFKAMTDPVSVWLDTHTVAGPEVFAPKKTLLTAYNDYCRSEGRAGMTPKAFTQALKRARPDVEEAQRTVAGVSKTWVWVGVGLKNNGDDGGGGGGEDHLPPKSQGSRHSRDSTNCFLFEETPQKGDKTPQKEDNGREEHSEITNKGKVVNVVNPVNGDEYEERFS